MTQMNLAALVFVSIGCMAGARGLLAQDFPAKPVRIVTSGIGGAGDIAARVIAQGLGTTLGQQVVVDNRASGVIPIEVVVRAVPDGYTILLYGSVVWLAPYLRDTVSYDPIKDLAPITLAVTSPNVLVVHPSLPVKSVADLIALARTKPGDLNYGSSGAGSSGHLAAELFNAMAKIRIVRVNYKGAGAALSDVIAGQVQLSFATATSISAHVQSGRLKALAVTSAKPSALLPNLPTIAGSGLSGYESASTSGIFAPAATPPAIIGRLNQEIVRALGRSDVKERFLNAGSEVVASTPAHLLAVIKADMSRMGKVIRDAGIRAE
jgi:tripartite-type tricarboxylate transporter receptor subunit TctC